jgi:putative methyltransferase (TIGR04325 family)
VTLREILKLLCPPVVRKAFNSIRNNRIKFSGDYSSWKEAENHSSGYDTTFILKKVQESAQMVTSGVAVYERDSVCFYEEAYRWPLLSCLLMIANKYENQLRVIDFGGSLGSLYFQHKRLLSYINPLSWTVVEQPHFVEAGKKQFENHSLKFHYTLEEAFNNADGGTVLVLSSVLQYLENPFALLKKASEMGFKYILIDRTPFINAKKDRITVQSVPASIYSASYPAWFFSSIRFEHLMRELGYQTVCSFGCDDDVGIGEFKGFLFERN